MVRERYLRTDITCQISDCKGCSGQSQASLDSQAKYLLIPDVNTAIDFLELFETLNITGIVIAQTILDALDNEIRVFNRKAIIRRLRRLTADKRRSSTVFPNEFFASTHYEAPSHQPALQRRDFAVAKLAAWLVSHSAKYQSASDHTRIIFVTDKPEVAEWARSQGVKHVLSMEEYVKSYFGDKEVQYYETLRQVASDAAESRSRASLPDKLNDDERNPFQEYTEYLSDEAIDAGIKSGLYFTGKLQVSSQSGKDAVVKLKMKLGMTSVIIPGEHLRNRALHGDRVVVVPVAAKDVWHNMSQYRDMQGTFARVVGIAMPSRRKFVCTIQEEASGGAGSEMLFAIPWDHRIPKIRIKSRQYSELVHSRVIIQLDSWDIESRSPSGHYVSSLGEIGIHETEMQVLLHESEVDTTAFAPAILAELPKTPWSPNINDASLGPRRDITDWRIYSIDPPGCQDIDDALSCRKLPNGNLEVGVHIADVAAFVEEGSKLDIEARARGTSVYLPDRRIDMLPTLLSERLCSLRVGEPRYAVSVIWQLDADGKVLDTWYGRTLIKTAHEMCYADAQAIIDGKEELRSRFSDYDLLYEELQGMRHVFHSWRKVREANGALDLETVEVSFVLDAETKRPQKVATKEALEVHALVAEFMIFANCAVAEHLARHLPQSAMLRRHPLPNANNFGEIIELARSRGIEMDFSSNHALAQSLHRAESIGDRMFTYTLRNLTTLAMAEAEYMSSGMFSPNEFYHYGLAVEFYTHFTSPIRRYADLVVHRQLLSILATQRGSTAPSSSYTPSNFLLQDIADHLNFKNRQSKEVQRNSKGLYQNMFFATRPNKDDVEIGVVTAIKSSSLVLYFPKFGYNCHFGLKDASKAGPVKFSSTAPTSSRQPGSKDSASTTEQGDAAESFMESFDRASDESEMTLHTSAGDHVVRLFDCVSVKIGVTANRYHMEKIQLRDVHFESKKFEELSSDQFSTKPAAGGTTPGSAGANSEKNAKQLDNGHNGAPSRRQQDGVGTEPLSSGSTATKSLSARGMINEVRKAEKSAKDKMAEEKMSLLPTEVKEMAGARVSALYRWCQFDSDSFIFTKLEASRVLASFVLSRRTLHSHRIPVTSSATPSETKTTKSRLKKPVCLSLRKRTATGRRTWKKDEYDAHVQLAKLSILSPEEDDEEYYETNEALSESIPGVSFAPSASFGSTTLTQQSQAARLGQAQARAEHEFRTQQAQVSKAKFASRHY